MRSDWKALEALVESDHWNQPLLTHCFARLLDTAPGNRWYGYCVSAVDDTKVHRSSADVWGTCTFHEYTARCPNPGSTGRAHNWAGLGRLLRHPDRPRPLLPQS